jgi:transposase
MKQVHSIYDKAFKEKALQLSYENTNVSKLHRVLGVTAPKLYKWRKEFEEFGEGIFPGNGNLKLTSEQEKIHELKKKLKYAKLERKILKKVIGLFSKSDQNRIFPKKYFGNLCIYEVVNILGLQHRITLHDLYFV